MHASDLMRVVGSQYSYDGTMLLRTIGISIVFVACLRPVPRHSLVSRLLKRQTCAHIILGARRITRSRTQLSEELESTHLSSCAT